MPARSHLPLCGLSALNRQQSRSIHLLPTAPLLLDPRHKLINHAGPRTILAPPAQTVVLECLVREAQRLIPHVLVDALLPLLLQELDPPLQPGIVRRRPIERRRGEKKAPVLNRSFEGDGFGALRFGDQEGVLVDFFEDGAVAGGEGGGAACDEACDAGGVGGTGEGQIGELQMALSNSPFL